MENVDPKTALWDRELVIVNQERNYCTQCYYLIAVITHEKKTDYTLSLDVLDQADFKNSKILKLGETYHDRVDDKADSDKKRVFRFILDDASPLTIVMNINDPSLTS